MIVKHFDQGWKGVKSATLQNLFVSQFTKRIAADSSKTVLVNHTWYHTNFDPETGTYCGEGSWFHDSIVEYLASNPVDQIVQYCLVDPAWPAPPALGHLGYGFDTPVIKVGWYPESEYWVDFVAIMTKYQFAIPADMAPQWEKIDTPFMCLNGKPHRHREEIVRDILRAGLETQGLVSFGGNERIPTMTLPDEDSHIKATAINPDPYDAMTFGPRGSWNRHFLNIVTETVMDVDREQFWSEKIHKPWLGFKPFLVYTPGGATAMLRKHGFEAFVNDFGDISDLDLRVKANIVPFLKELCQQPVSYLQSKYQQLLPKMLHNRAQFDVYARRQIDQLRRPL